MTITEEEVESAKKIREPEIQEPDQEQEPTQQPTQGQQKPGQKPVQQPTQGQQQLNPRAVPEIIFGRKTTIKDNEKNIEWSSSNNKRNEITNKNFGELKEWLESDEIKNKFEENKFVIDSILLKGLVNALEQKIIGLEEVKNAITAMMNRNKKVLENIIKIRYDKSDLSKWTFPWNKKNRDIVAQSADRYERTAEVVGEYEPNPFKRLLKRMKIRALPAGKNERKETIVNKDQETKGIVTEQYIALSTKFEELENRNDIDKWLDEVNDKYNAKEINDEEFMELYKRGSEEAKLIQKDKNKAFRDSMTQNEVNENINNENNNTETEKKQEEPTQQEEGR